MDKTTNKFEKPSGYKNIFSTQTVVKKNLNINLYK